jgi:hypothetical protein
MLAVPARSLIGPPASAFVGRQDIVSKDAWALRTSGLVVSECQVYSKQGGADVACGKNHKEKPPQTQSWALAFHAVSPSHPYPLAGTDLGRIVKRVHSGCSTSRSVTQSSSHPPLHVGGGEGTPEPLSPSLSMT